jgi:hypothetical protein
MVAGSHHPAGARLTDLCGDYDDASRRHRSATYKQKLSIPKRRTAQTRATNTRVICSFHRALILIFSQFPQLELLSLTQRFTAGLDRSEETMLGTILIIVLILLLIGALPTWPYSGGWGYYPGGGLGLILVIVIVLVLVGRI